MGRYAPDQRWVALSGGSGVVRFRSSGAAGVPVNNGAGVTTHRWLKVAFIPSNLVKATFSHHRTTSEDTTVTPTTSAQVGVPGSVLAGRLRHGRPPPVCW